MKIKFISFKNISFKIFKTKKMQPHNHAELIKKWANGSEVQRWQDGEWVDDYFPSWMNDDLFRLKNSNNNDVDIETGEKKSGNLKVSRKILKSPNHTKQTKLPLSNQLICFLKNQAMLFSRNHKACKYERLQNTIPMKTTAQ